MTDPAPPPLEARVDELERELAELRADHDRTRRVLAGVGAVFATLAAPDDGELPLAELERREGDDS